MAEQPVPTAWACFRRLEFATGESHLFCIRVFTGPDAEKAATREKDDQNNNLAALFSLRLEGFEPNDEEGLARAVVFATGIRSIAHAALPVAHQETSLIVIPNLRH